MATKNPFAVKHNLDQLSKEELVQYLRDVSEFIGLDPDLNGLDTIYMNNETGPGRSLVVYARRGTAEILRNLLGVNVDELSDHMVNGSIVYTAKGHNKDGRKEQAVGSKNLQGLTGKILDDAIMTASTRALRRLTMQFTTLGILDESEISAAKSEAPSANAAAAATLAPNPMPLIFAQPSVPANNTPGKPVQTPVLETVIEHEAKTISHTKPLPEAPVAAGDQFVGQQDQIDAAMAQVAAKQADKKADMPPAAIPVTAVESTTSPETSPVTEADMNKPVAAARPKRARKPKNTVALDVEAEVVTAPAAPPPTLDPDRSGSYNNLEAPKVPAPPPQPAPEQPPVSTQANPVVPTPAIAAPVAGMPTKEQMDSYRARVGVYTAQLPASQDLGSVQKMRSFITHVVGAAPQNMTVAQWEEMVAWFDAFVEKNQMRGLIKFINDALGVR